MCALQGIESWQAAAYFTDLPGGTPRYVQARLTVELHKHEHAVCNILPHHKSLSNRVPGPPLSGPFWTCDSDLKDVTSVRAHLN